MEEDQRRVVITIDVDTKEQLRAVASSYGASIRRTIVRYVREGLEREDAARKAPGDTLQAQDTGRTA